MMKKTIITVLAAILCLSTVFAFSVEAAYYNTYTDLASVPDYGGCSAMQGMAVGSTYMYTVKINSANSLAVLYKTNRTNGKCVLLKNSSGSPYIKNLGHANDMCVTSLDGYSTLFVVTMQEGKYSLVKIRVSGSTFKVMGNYTIKQDGKAISMSGVSILSKTSTKINFLFKKGSSFYKGSMNLGANSGTVNVTKAFTINNKQVKINGKTLDLSSHLYQGFGYYKNYIYVPFTHANVSIIAVYDIKNASGTIKNKADLSFRITSKAYTQFEIESCGICTSDGKLYFNTNRANKNGAYDGVHYFNKYKAA